MAAQDDYLDGLITLPFTVLSGQMTSNKIYTSGATLAALVFPAGWVAATVGLNVSADDVNYYPLFNGTTGVAYSILTNASQAVPVDLFFVNGFRYFQLVSSTAPASNVIIQGQFIPLVNKEWN